MSGAGQLEPVRMRIDDPLAGFRARGGGVAFVGPDLPIDVLLASGRAFGHLPWRADGSTDWADRWLESSFPRWARSVLEQWHDGVFDGIDTVVFSRGDDASQRLYYYVAELRRRGKLRGPAPRAFDIAFARRDSSLAHTEAAVTELMQALGVSPAALPAGIERANRLRRTVAALERERSANGPVWERLSRAALWTDPTQWLDDVTMPAGVDGRPRVVLAGSVPVDERLHEAVESAGASVVAEAHAFALDRLGPELGEPGARAIARHLREASVGPRAFADHAARTVARARAARADAVVLWLAREDEGLAWTVPAQQRALAAAGIPALVLPAARWQADGDTPARIAGFLRGCADAPA